MTALLRPGETPAERTLEKMRQFYAREVELAMSPATLDAYAARMEAAIDMGREALAAGREIVEVIDSLPDIWSVGDFRRMARAVNAMRALLARAGEE